MNPVAFGLAAGVIFGAVDVALMIPLSIAGKETAMLAAFASRFAIGFLIPLVKLPAPHPVRGAAVGLLISLPDAIVTGSYAPILASGLAGGAIIGFLAGKFASGRPSRDHGT